MKKRNTAGQFMSEDEDVALIPPQFSLKKLLILFLLILLLLPHYSKFQAYFSNFARISECQSEDAISNSVYAALDQAYGRKTSDVGFEWNSRYDKRKKKQDTLKEYELEKTKKQIKEKAEQRAYTLVEEKMAEELMKKILDANPNLTKIDPVDGPSIIQSAVKVERPSN